LFIQIEYNLIIHKPPRQISSQEKMIETKPQHARAIGEKLRAVRQERQMSLRELASKAEMSASMLSQIETGKVFPSVRSLYGIADALDVSVDYFFPEQNNGRVPPKNGGENSQGTLTASEMRDARLNGTPEMAQEFAPHTESSAPVVHANTRPIIELNGGVIWSRLTALAEKGAEFLEITYSPGAMSGTNMSHHEGREFGLILEGELVIELGFESYTLHAGDSIVFESAVPHRLHNKHTKPMRAVWVVLSQQ
jgi:transcriptional regulator with XRE-family HTH domain/mannose-6-phosphate isomerase-like protein (cupin superfamily)